MQSFHRYHNTGCEQSTTSLSPDYMLFTYGGPPIHTPSVTNALCSQIILPEVFIAVAANRTASLYVM
ncbi:uncharacterized protein B0H18DRAFT_1119157 [Fomitopsis serialis]|uniref:uncharacterized protein n=1 Tax=Fomitopsis serialis TaxID=139415 RepID=UPI002008D8F7|nr:uncharacterized protein B0H18DRAFT_1119157 [Neoantrodia serialis]KAH9925992.1 hypothetical protein B0H18DRAFT_1119157 [Neoantrodia serialis]